MSKDWRAQIQSHYAEVLEKIAAAAAQSGRPPDSVKLVAISKGQPTEAIEGVFDLGIKEIGENRVAEALSKQGVLSHLAINWHMVGHIQSRKAKDIPGHFAWVHSVDRLKIANRLSQFAVAGGIKLPILLECNVTGEASKEGWNVDQRSRWPGVLPEFEEILTLPGVEVKGLMTMAPWVADESILRSTFQTLRSLADFLSNHFGRKFEELSMGMTDDYEIAIEEGATIVRIGRAIFGPR